GRHRLAAAGPPGVFLLRRRLRLGEIGDGLGAEQLERVGVAIDWMAAPVEAERLLLEAELLGLGRRRGRRQRRVRRAAGISPLVLAAEQVVLAAVARALHA